MTDDQAGRLIAAAMNGDAVAMAALVDFMAPIIHLRVARVLLRRRGQSRGRALRPDAEDLVQEVFGALFARSGKALRAWDPQRGLPLGSFIGFLAEREVGMIMRSHRRNPWTEDPTTPDRLVYLSGTDRRSEARIESRDMLRRVADYLRVQLSPRGRQYFQLLYVENRSVADVAEETGATASALYAWRSRLTKQLRQLKLQLEAEDGDDV